MWDCELSIYKNLMLYFRILCGWPKQIYNLHGRKVHDYELDYKVRESNHVADDHLRTKVSLRNAATPWHHFPLPWRVMTAPAEIKWRHHGHQEDLWLPVSSKRILCLVMFKYLTGSRKSKMNWDYIRFSWSGIWQLFKKTFVLKKETILRSVVPWLSTTSVSYQRGSFKGPQQIVRILTPQDQQTSCTLPC